MSFYCLTSTEARGPIYNSDLITPLKPLKFKKVSIMNVNLAVLNSLHVDRILTRPADTSCFGSSNPLGDRHKSDSVRAQADLSKSQGDGK